MNKLVEHGNAECVVVPYHSGYRGEYDAGVLEVESNDHPGLMTVSVSNTDARCPPRPTKDHPELRAKIYLTKVDALKFREVLDAAIAALPDDGHYP
jgi:hypothetical protein